VTCTNKHKPCCYLPLFFFSGLQWVVGTTHIWMGRRIFEIRVLFAGWPNSERSSCTPEMQDQPRH